MIKKMLLTSLILVFLFLAVWNGYKPKILANEINGSYDYSYNLGINNDSYYLVVNEDMSNTTLLDIFENGINYTYSITLVNDNVIYDSIRIISSDGLGGVLCYAFDTSSSSRLDLFEWFNNTLNIHYNKKLSMYNDIDYTIITDNIFNELFKVQNRINGFYTFNNHIQALTFNSYNFNEPTTDYTIKGSLVYSTETNYYLISEMSLNVRTTAFAVSLYNVSNGAENYDIIDSFSDDEQNLRYLYFDTQYIDTYFYQWLKLNGIFDLVFQPTDIGFTDLFSAFANIPITMFRSLLDFSIFNTTGTTLLIIFASGLVIALAIKVVRLFMLMR